MSSMLEYVASTAATHNDSLPESIRTRARRLINQAYSEVGYIDSEVARLRTMMDELDLRRRNKLAEVELYQSALSPLRKLPNELLSLIFISCCDDTIAVPYKLNQQQWNLSRVCSKWWNVSLSTPELWNNIRINHSSHNCGTSGKNNGIPPIPYTTYVKMVENVLHRSGKTPLSVTILNDTNNTVRPLDPFLLHLDRIRELSLQKASSTVKAFLALPSHLVPSLHAIDIIDYSKVDISDGGVLQYARYLRKVEYRSYKVPLIWIYKLPLAQLTHLNIPSSMLRPAQVLGILQLAPNLQECAFAVGAPPPNSQPSSNTESLSTPFHHDLHTFHLNLFATDNEITALQHLVLPNLRHFVFQTGQERDWDPRWAPMIIRSRSIETLILRDTIVSPSQLEHLLHASPNLCKLDISSGRMLTPPLLQKLALGVLVPRLTTLRCLIESTPMGERAFELHLDMLEQRKMNADLASHIGKVLFTLYGVEDMSLMYPGLQPRLSQMNGQGWDIVISCPSIDVYRE